ncbi:MAG: murein transglycosylase A [Magnetovibrionaceae bacterium]
MSLGLLLVACAPKKAIEPTLDLKPSAFSSLQGWSDHDVRAAVAALSLSCDRLKNLPEARPRGPNGLTAGDWAAACAHLSGSQADGAEGAEVLRNRLEALFQPFAVTDAGNPEGLITGYFEAELHGSRNRGGPFQTALLGLPEEAVSINLGDFRDNLKGTTLVGRLEGGRLKPLPDRAEIEAGAYAGQGLEILWVDDPVDAFFLHIQGSGRVRMDSGETLRVGYAGKNGHVYRAIGRDLIASGAVRREDMSMQAIRDWLEANPGQAEDLMNKNRSYVFFREIPGPGPIGAQGVPLTAGASIAIDPRFIPYGAPIWLETTHPLEPGQMIRRLVIAQDTGGAIRGVVRGDLFWGFGEEAARLAGAMKQPGRYWILLPKKNTARPVS